MENIEKLCRNYLLSQGYADPAHDLLHVQRVVSMAKKLAIKEGADLDVVVPAAWLHDCVPIAKNDSKRTRASKLSADCAISFLKSHTYLLEKLDSIHHAIHAHSYSALISVRTLEAKVLQDADRMDALGAIGISRCMQVSGSLAMSLYHEEDPFCQERTADDALYTLDHFFVKLFKIANSMNTETAKKEAFKRTRFMKIYFSQLKRELHF